MATDIGSTESLSAFHACNLGRGASLDFVGVGFPQPATVGDRQARGQHLALDPLDAALAEVVGQALDHDTFTN